MGAWQVKDTTPSHIKDVKQGAGNPTTPNSLPMNEGCGF